jgi:hypothetical protein
MLGPTGPRRSLGALEVEPFGLPMGEGALPLEVVLAEVDGQLHGLLRYRADIDEAVAEHLVVGFLAVLERVADDAGVALDDLQPAWTAGR